MPHATDPSSHASSHTPSAHRETTTDRTITAPALVELDRVPEPCRQADQLERRSAASDARASVELMTVQDVARYLGVPVGTLRNWRVTGDGPPAARIGRHVRYRRADVESWVAERVRLDVAQRRNGS
jgi:excisionase family DNA binding protein